MSAVTSPSIGNGPKGSSGPFPIAQYKRVFIVENVDPVWLLVPFVAHGGHGESQTDEDLKTRSELELELTA